MLDENKCAVMEAQRETEKVKWEEVQTHKLKELRAAYAAGIIDGEGCITASFRPEYGEYGQVRVCVGNTDEAMIKWLQQHFGGSVYNYPTTKKMFQWHIFCKNAEKFLRIVLPYLITKKEEALIALELRKVIVERKNKTKNGRGHKISEEEKVHRNILIDKLHELKGDRYVG